MGILVDLIKFISSCIPPLSSFPAIPSTSSIMRTWLLLAVFVLPRKRILRGHGVIDIERGEGEEWTVLTCFRRRLRFMSLPTPTFKRFNKVNNTSQSLCVQLSLNLKQDACSGACSAYGQENNPNNTRRGNRV